MKTTLKMILAATFVLFQTSVSMAHGQNNSEPSNSEINLYASMSDLLNGSSNKSITAKLEYRAMGWGILYIGLVVEKETQKNVGRVFGFESDGKIYVNPRTPRLKRINNFFEAQRIGPFLNYKVVEGGPVGPSSVQVRYPAEKLLNVETGKTRTLTRKRFRKLAKDDAELLKRFEQEPKKSKVLTEYLKEYYERKQK